MIPLRVQITGYNKSSNILSAKLLNGDYITLDPFVSCAIEMTDEEYENDKGFELIGSSYILIEYTVYKDSVVPDNMILI